MNYHFGNLTRLDTYLYPNNKWQLQNDQAYWHFQPEDKDQWDETMDKVLRPSDPNATRINVLTPVDEPHLDAGAYSYRRPSVHADPIPAPKPKNITQDDAKSGKPKRVRTSLAAIDVAGEFKMVIFRSLFRYFRFFNTVERKQYAFNINFANDWFRTAELFTNWATTNAQD